MRPLREVLPAPPYAVRIRAQLVGLLRLEALSEEQRRLYRALRVQNKRNRDRERALRFQERSA